MRHQFYRQPSFWPEEQESPPHYKKHSTRKTAEGNPSLEFLTKLPPLEMIQLIYRNLELGFISALTQGCYSPLPGAEPYSPEVAQPLVEEVTTQHHFSPENAIADAAYDAGHFYEYLAIEHQANGIIDLNPRNGTQISRDDIMFDQEGTPHCYLGALKNWGWDEKRQRRKWRALGCDTCMFRTHCNPSPYGRVVYTMPANDYRLFGKVIRGSEEWKQLYNKRTSVERVNSGLKGSHQLGNVKVRGLEAVTIHATMSAIARLVQHIALAEIWNTDKFQLARAA